MKKVLAGVFFSLILLFITPAWAFFTGWMDKNTEVSMGQDLARQYEAKYGARQDPWVTQVGQKMIPFTGRTDIEYHFKVLNIDEPNAMALMGGFVYINQGLLKLVKDDEGELAFILGHEMAHVAKKHMVKNVEKAVSGGLILGLVFGRSNQITQQVVSVAWDLVQLGYSREEEYQADHFGAECIIKAGYKPEAALLVLEKLQKLGGGGPEFLMNHPDMEKRINRVKSDYAQYF